MITNCVFPCQVYMIIATVTLESAVYESLRIGHLDLGLCYKEVLQFQGGFNIGPAGPFWKEAIDV